MKKIFFPILLALSGVICFSSCDEFDVENVNPDVAQSINNNPELLLTGVQRDAVNRMVGASWSEGNLMAQYGARIVFTSFDLFDWGDQSGEWDRLYLSIRDAKSLEAIAIENGNTSYEAVSLIMQSWMFQILTDMWGDIPYSDASKALSDEVFGPSYDTQSDIYNGLLANLEKANSLLSSTDLLAIKGDIIFNGDLSKWRKFANSLRLRVAMRLSEVDPGSAQGTISKIYSSLGQNPVMESNDDNAVLEFLSSFPNAHPISEANRYRVGSYNEYRISETLEGLLRGYNDDPRLFFFADPTANSVAEGTPEIAGMKNGIVDGPAYEYKGGDAFLSKFAIDFFHFQPNSNEGRLMTFSEVAFIMAEAAERGWIGADAADWYDVGVTANFDYWNVELPTGYLTDVAPYDGTLETIGNQKYIALFYIDYQGFIEYKRTGFPTTIQPGPDAFYNVYPSRFEYPSKEQALNAESYDAAVARQGADEITTKLWWEN